MLDGTCEERIDTHLQKVADDVKVFMEDEDGNADTGPFHSYALSADMVEMGTFEEQTQPYFRYQISWGGPSDEVRFFPDGQIEYWFMDWFDGARRNVTGQGWAEWLRDTFVEIGALNWE
jgi:hypothetical protein